MSQSNTPALAATCLVAGGDVLGEGPVWIAREQALYWTDIKGLKLHRLEPVTGAKASWPTPLSGGWASRWHDLG